MPLATGTRLGPYEVIAQLGQGGMGEVYKARDTRLDRTVAIKTLAPALAADAVFRERFEREARTLSGLSHPNVCTVFDVGTAPAAASGPGVDYLVMEFLEGRTLADVLERGAPSGSSALRPAGLAAGEALRLAAQIADALIAAHRVGLVHRDLKPANVMIVGSGTATTAKLLDFGLAKRAPVTGAALTGAHTATEATRAAPLTGAGTILGTFQYMAPEQIEGREADVRADVWAFGCVLYEMLAGRRAFDAPTQASLIAAILERAPAPVELPDPHLSPAVNRLTDACLEKNPDDRFQSMRDVRRALDWVAKPLTAAHVSGAGPKRRGWTPSIAAASALIGIAAIAAFAVLVGSRSADSGGAAASMFTIPLGSSLTAGSSSFFGGAGSGTPQVSPDGRKIAFLAHDLSGSRIYLRDIGGLELQALRGTDGARGLFWSPDEAFLGFFANGKLQTYEFASGRTEAVCDAPLAFGGTWAADGTILFSPDERAPLFRVNARGGTPAKVTTLGEGEQAHRWPHFLPDGRRFVYMPWSDSTTNRQVMVGSLDGGAPKALFEAQTAAVPAGDYLFYVSDLPSRLMAWRFDSTRLETVGQPFAIVGDDNVDYQWYTGEPNVSAAGSTLAYTTGKYRTSQLTWLDRSGRSIGTLGDPGIYFDPMLSQDGSMVALEKTDPGRGTGDIWTIDLVRGAFSRLTSAPGYESVPAWSPDGRIVYSSDQTEKPGMFVSSASGIGGATLLLTPPQRGFPLDWSRDGRYLLFLINGGSMNNNDVWIDDLQRHTVAPLFATPFSEGSARFSPDGRWIAYASDESQQPEVYLRSFPDPSVKVRISTNGGTQPQWRKDGRELYYIAPDNSIDAVPLTLSGTRLNPATPEPLFTANVDQTKTIRNQYAASQDGQRFLVLSLVNRNESPIVAVLNWRSLVKE